MKRRNSVAAFFSATAILFLILDSKTAFQGAMDGVSLSIHTLIPSLFPFLFLSGMLIDSLYTQSYAFLRFPGIIFGLPKGTETILIPAFLGGYPVGAQCISSAVHKRQLNRNNAEKMLAFCSNAGPSFIFGVLNSQFRNTSLLWLCWIIQVVSSIMVSCIFRIDANDTSTLSLQPKNAPIMEQSISTMGKICGWVILFRILLCFLDKWFFWLLPDWERVLITGIIELSNGCCILSRISSESFRFVICCAMLSTGGICVLMQTISVCEGLSIRYYLIGKMLQCIIAVLLAISFVSGKTWLVIFLCSPFAIFKVKNKNKSRITASIGV